MRDAYPQKYKSLQEEHYALKEICQEQEKTLEELGGQLSAAKLAAVELRENAAHLQGYSPGEAQLHPPDGTAGTATWANDRMVTQCKGCSREFNIARRKVIKLFNYPSPGPMHLSERARANFSRTNRLPVIIPAGARRSSTMLYTYIYIYCARETSISIQLVRPAFCSRVAGAVNLIRK